MKVVLDLSRLLDEGKITQSEFDRFSQFALQETGSLAFNILVGFGVISVSAASIMLVPTAITAIVIGVLVGFLGLSPLRFSPKWAVLSHICVLVGAMLLSGGILWLKAGSVMAWVIVTVLLAVVGIIIHHGLLIVMSVLALSAAVGAASGYDHAMYMIVIQQPAITILLFTFIAYAAYRLSLLLPVEDQHLAILASRTSIFLVNMGFWVGSLWGDQLPNESFIPTIVFVVLWAIALVATGVWAAKVNRRWVVNICAIFAAIHFYTQWFEYLGAEPLSVLIAGLLVLVFALGLWRLNAGPDKFRVKRRMD